MSEIPPSPETPKEPLPSANNTRWDAMVHALRTSAMEWGVALGCVGIALAAASDPRPPSMMEDADGVSRRITDEEQSRINKLIAVSMLGAGTMAALSAVMRAKERR